MYRLPVLLFLAAVICRCNGKILTECKAVEELQKAKISRTFISNWVCLMKSESGLDTRLMTGPRGNVYSYGIFQIKSDKWCSRGRPGGVCNKRCEDFLNDDISDDIACAKRIFEEDGFKHWSGWLKSCKNKPLPDISKCKKRRSIDDEIDVAEIDE